ncbi:MAG: hypothetical protein IMW97_08590 [Firmicutes bacterium]|nr:hypothetical protein [Candidatus Fermentithermobacillaceae bacterium]
MRTPAALFPFYSQLLPYVRQFEELQDEYLLRRLVSLSGFGLCGRDAAYSRNQPELGIRVTDTLEPDDPTWDVLLLTRAVGTEAAESILESEAERVLVCGKAVLYFGSSITSVPKRMWTLSEAYPGRVHIHAGETGMPVSLRVSNNYYNHLHAPVVLVGGLVEEADTSEVLLRLAVRLRADGLFFTGIVRHSIGKLFGLHTLDHIFDRKDLTEAEKIQKLNVFLKTLEIEERPDVIIVEAPDALMRFSDFAPNGFGIRTYMVCQAARPDFLVCCVPCDMVNGDFLDVLSLDFERRLGCPIHAAHVSNVVVDAMDAMQRHSISYVHADMNAVSKQVARWSEDSAIPLFDVVGDGIEGLYGRLCDAVTLGKRG